MYMCLLRKRYGDFACNFLDNDDRVLKVLYNDFSRRYGPRDSHDNYAPITHNEGKTAFQLAMEQPHFGEIANLLLTDKFNVNDVFSNRTIMGLNRATTGLHALAAMRSNKEDVIRLIKIFLERKANIEATDYAQQTPLHVVAAASGFNEVAELLLQHGADMHAIDSLGRTPESFTKPKNRGGIDASQRLWPIFKKYRELRDAHTESSAESTHSIGRMFALERKVDRMSQEIAELKMQIASLTTGGGAPASSKVTAVPRSSSSSSSSSSYRSPPCKFFNGTPNSCSNGNACKFSHTMGGT